MFQADNSMCIVVLGICAVLMIAPVLDILFYPLYTVSYARASKHALESSQRRTKEVEQENQLLNSQLQVHAGAQPSQEEVCFQI